MNRFWLSAAIISICSGTASAQVFLPGNLAVYRLGDGSAALSNASTAAFVEQYTIGGSLVGSPIALPTAGATAITNSGTATSEGFMSLSTDGHSLVFGGYNVAPGLASVATSTGTAAPRSVGLVNSAGSFTLSSLGTLAYSGGNIRSAFSTNGSDIWVAGSNQSIQYHLAGSGTSTQLSTTITNTRVVNVLNNQLYTSANTGAFQGVNTVGTGLPTSSGQTISLLPGYPTASGPSGYQFVGFDSPNNPNSFNGIDTIYLADDRASASGGIQRWTFDGTNWNLAATGAVGTNIGARALTGSISGTSVQLYAITAEGSGNRLVSLTDDLSTGTFGTFSTLVTAPTNQIFRGVAFTPTPVPEPASILLVGAGTMLIGRFVRRRKA